MSFSSHVSRKYLFAFCLFTLVLAVPPSSYTAEPSAKQSGEEIAQESTSMYGQAVAHAEDALQAARGKAVKSAVTHAEKAIESARAAQRDFNTMKIAQEVQQDFAEGIRSLEDVVPQANKGNIELIALFETALIKTLVLWHGVAGNKGCHGDGCQVLASGCCAVPNQTNCNRYFKTRKCTNAGSPCNACYCM